MSTTNTQSLNKFHEAKDNKFKAQLKKVYQAFKEKPMTMKEADVYTGVMRENICRYVDMLLDQERIAIRKKRKCSITGYPYVNEYTGDPSLFPKSNQLKMF
ncbi:hypothetical protein FHG64_16010 [Antarcticibacterium flavum]|uniref:Transcriptional regulator n=1 Tax=Antarcticibacterium flavum TaxID=2058175 RepID=A0A5B7X7Z6_9FLAO|nr:MULTISPECIES: hypothetical protein [Antarcticibacterium]MCM4161868.1 hypothetical protein [Antarcticibacterium sp. W02-3]QCY70773.1 hypothetical protein FHG64_16010 [Antarcticibacterium flavum]